MMAPLIGLGLGLGAGGAAAALGVGKNTNKATSFGDSKQYDPNAGHYLQTTTGNRWEGMGEAGQQRQGVALDNGLGNESRGYQQDAIGMMRDAAMGNRPSVAQMQMQQGLDQAMRQQQSMAASARGPAALAMAQYGAAQNSGAAAQDIAAQTSMLRAQEMANALGQYGQMGTSIRGQDEQRAMTQAELEARQRQLNDQYQLGLIGQANQANLGNLQGRVAMQGTLANSWNAAQGANAQANQANANNEWKQFGALMGGAQGGMQMGGMMPSAPATTGGPTAAAESLGSSFGGNGGSGRPW